MINYILKFTICLVILLVFYHFVLQKEKMHNFNRFFLMGSLLLSFLIPQYTIYVDTTVITETALPYVLEDPIALDVVEDEQETSFFDFNLVVQTIYLIITGLFLLRFVKNISNIVGRIHKHEIINFHNAKLVLVTDNIAPHTFWNYIFINKDAYQNNRIEEELFTHELTHVTQNHTFDIILIELLHAIFWFNPVFIYLKKAIRLNHEFIADASVIDTHNNTITYQELLLKRSSDPKEYYLASNLNFILTKKRLLMMTKQKSDKAILLKKMSVIPLLFGLLFLLAERVEALESKTEIEPNSDIKSDVFLASVERDGNAIQLKCYNCKRWGNLTIPLHKEYIITDFGFTNKNRISDASEYAFTIKATKNNITFLGLKNTAWETLKFTLDKNKKQYLNEFGTVDFKSKDVLNYKTKTAPILYIDKDQNKYYLNNRLINIDNIKNEFLKETNGQKSNLEIFCEGKVLMSFLKSIQNNLTKQYLNEIILPNSLSYIEVDDDYLNSKNDKNKLTKTSDSIPKKRIVNQKKKTLTYTTKDGKLITKKFSELTPWERNMLPPPPPPMKIHKKKVTAKLLKELQNSNTYAIWIDGKVAKNSILKNYKPSDFKYYSGSFVHKNARNKRFPQPYQFYLETKGYKNKKTAAFQKKFQKWVKEGNPQSKSPKQKVKDNVKPTKKNISKVNDDLFFIKNDKGITYYNRFGQEVTKNGALITPKTNTKMHGAIVRKGDSTNIPPPAKAKNEKGWYYNNNQTLYYVKNDKGTTYYNRFGQEVTENGALITPKTSTKTHGAIVKKGDSTNIPPPKAKERNFTAKRRVKIKKDITSNQIKKVLTKKTWEVDNYVHFENGTKKKKITPQTVNKLNQNTKINYFLEDKKISEKKYYSLIKADKEYLIGGNYTNKKKDILNMYLTKDQKKLNKLLANK